jgi:hypothetical protein
MPQSYLKNPSIERLSSLLEDLHNGNLRIPPFQRDFEWKLDQRLALCESVRLGLPTGSLMVWRTQRPLRSENPIGPYRLPEVPNGSSPQYLLDGRQRMTTLYAALAGAFWTRAGEIAPVPGHDVATAPDGSDWQIFYDLTNEKFISRRAFVGLDLEQALKCIPLDVLLDDGAYDDWRANHSLTREHTNQARALRSAFYDYSIPVVPLATDDIGVVTLTFKRINNGGTPMSDADMARALAWSENFDLRTHVDEARASLSALGWGQIDDDTLLKVVAAVGGLDATETDPEELAKMIKASPDVVTVASARVSDAAGFLRERLGIAGPGSLPYAQILVFVARSYHEMNGAMLSDEQREEMAAWVAEACLDERFGGAPPHMVRAFWRTLANRLGLPRAEAPRPRDGKPSVAKECWMFSMSWARSRGTALVLAAQKPRYADGNEMVDPASLIAQGSENIGMLIAEGAAGLPDWVRQYLRALKGRSLATALRSPANRVICPPSQLPALRGLMLNQLSMLLFFGDVGKSHLVSDEAGRALGSRDLGGFFDARRRAILDAERQWVAERGGTVDLRAEPRGYLD